MANTLTTAPTPVSIIDIKALTPAHPDVQAKTSVLVSAAEIKAPNPSQAPVAPTEFRLVKVRKPDGKIVTVKRPLNAAVAKPKLTIASAKPLAPASTEAQSQKAQDTTLSIAQEAIPNVTYMLQDKAVAPTEKISKPNATAVTMSHPDEATMTTVLSDTIAVKTTTGTKWHQKIIAEHVGKAIGLFTLENLDKALTSSTQLAAAADAIASGDVDRFHQVAAEGLTKRDGGGIAKEPGELLKKGDIVGVASKNGRPANSHTTTGGSAPSSAAPTVTTANVSVPPAVNDRAEFQTHAKATTAVSGAPTTVLATTSNAGKPTGLVVAGATTNAAGAKPATLILIDQKTSGSLSAPPTTVAVKPAVKTVAKVGAAIGPPSLLGQPAVASSTTIADPAATVAAEKKSSPIAKVVAKEMPKTASTVSAPKPAPANTNQFAINPATKDVRFTAPSRAPEQKVVTSDATKSTAPTQQRFEPVKVIPRVPVTAGKPASAPLRDQSMPSQQGSMATALGARKPNTSQDGEILTATAQAAAGLPRTRNAPPIAGQPISSAASVTPATRPGAAMAPQQRLPPPSGIKPNMNSVNSHPSHPIITSVANMMTAHPGATGAVGAATVLGGAAAATYGVSHSRDDTSLQTPSQQQDSKPSHLIPSATQHGDQSRGVGDGAAVSPYGLSDSTRVSQHDRDLQPSYDPASDGQVHHGLASGGSDGAGFGCGDYEDFDPGLDQVIDEDDGILNHSHSGQQLDANSEYEDYDPEHDQVLEEGPTEVENDHVENHSLQCREVHEAYEDYDPAQDEEISEEIPEEIQSNMHPATENDDEVEDYDPMQDEPIEEYDEDDDVSLDDSADLDGAERLEAHEEEHEDEHEEHESHALDYEVDAEDYEDHEGYDDCDVDYE